MTTVTIGAVKRWRSIVLLVLVACANVPVFAHGEQVLVFPISLALLFIPAVVILAVPWHRWWARGITAAALLGSNVALWFSPFVPQTVGELAGANLNRIGAILLVVPTMIGTAIVGILLRIGRRRAAVMDQDSQA